MFIIISLIQKVNKTCVEGSHIKKLFGNFLCQLVEVLYFFCKRETIMKTIFSANLAELGQKEIKYEKNYLSEKGGGAAQIWENPD